MLGFTDVERRLNQAITLFSAAQQLPEAPATASQIQHACDYLRQRFDLTMPPAQVEFWQRTNGLDFNGLSWYRAQGIDAKNPFIPSFVDVNEMYHETTQGGVVMLVDSDINMYFYDVSLRRYVVGDKPSMSEMEAFPSAEALLCYTLDKFIAQWENHPLPDPVDYQP